MQHRKHLRVKGYDYSQAGGYYVTIVTQGHACLFGEIRNEEMVLNDAGNMVVRWWDELANKFPSITPDVFIVMPNHFHGIIFIHESVGADLCVGPDPDVDPSERGEHAGSPLPDNEGVGKNETGEHATGEHAGSPLPNNDGVGKNETGEHTTGEHTGSPLPDNEGVGKTETGEHVTGEHAGSPLPNNDGVEKNETGEHATGEHAGSPLRIGGKDVSLSQIVQWFKTMATNEYIRGVKQFHWKPFPSKLWQRNYYEHIIRNELDYERIANYIVSNPANWAEDEENQ